MANEELSKLLSYLLRHNPESKNISLNRQGWAPVDQLVDRAGFTHDEILEIVREDSKSRYALSADLKMIRANQGHSTSQVRMIFEKAIPPVILYHGTTTDKLPGIIKQGLKPMTRHHVHLSAEKSTAAEVGGRRKKGHIVIAIDTKEMLADGIQFYKSENGVWLVDHVDPQYFIIL